MCERTASVLREIFPSPEMASYLSKSTFARRDMRDAVAYAVIPLKRKRDLFLQLAVGRDKTYFRHQAASIERAIRAMRPKPGEFFYLKSQRYDMEKGLEPYLTWEHIFERIQEYLGYLEDEEKEVTWFQVEKWSPDGTGQLKNEYDYIIFGMEVCWFSHNTSSGRDWYEFSIYHDVNLPVPFHAGDIVTIDCRPFAPENYAVLLEVGDNRDCCCLQALFRESDGTWDTGAVKHGYASPNRSPGLSPLYRLATFHGQLPEEDRLLETVSRYIDGDEEYGSALWYHIYGLKGDRLKQPVTKAQILSYISKEEGAENDDI